MVRVRGAEGGKLVRRARVGEGAARVEVRQEDDHHVICVSDNGVGIPPEHHERIFEIFQSLGPRSGGRRSTGIGLAIVKKIVETHGGMVSVESRPSEGATFRVHLPRA